MGQLVNGEWIKGSISNNAKLNNVQNKISIQGIATENALLELSNEIQF